MRGSDRQIGVIRFGPAPSRPTFVMIGTIEGRKNHLLLLHIWEKLAKELGPATPKLVLIGQRGWL